MSDSEHDELMHAATDELSRIVLAEMPLESILDRIAELTKQMLPAAAEVSVTLIDQGNGATAAATGDLALAVDERQYETGHGPCLDASRSGTEFHIHDMTTETRWPDFTPRAVQAGALSSLSVPLPVRQARSAH